MPRSSRTRATSAPPRARPPPARWRSSSLRAPPLTLGHVHAWCHRRWDQGEFNRLARYQWKPQKRDGLSDPRLFWAYKAQVIGGVLPLSLFCGGHNYFVSQFAQRHGWKPYSIHTTYQYAAAPTVDYGVQQPIQYATAPAVATAEPAAAATSAAKPAKTRAATVEKKKKKSGCC